VLLASGCSKSTQSIKPVEQGQRGESCQARNDCQSGLACIKNTCVQNDFPTAVSPKECDLIQCSTAADCCADFTMSSFCTSDKANCAAGDTFSCDEYTANCTCNQDCVSNKCVTSTTCQTSSDCFSASSTCVNNKCVECAVDTDCQNTGDTCVSGKCTAGCKTSDECPLLQTCVSGACKATGCSSDRECYGYTKNPLAKCVDTKCIVPCENDGECDQFEACQSGACVFIGCETDDECRYLETNFTPSTSATKVHAVCRVATL
jgi:hypothetical protein